MIASFAASNQPSCALLLPVKIRGHLDESESSTGHQEAYPPETRHFPASVSDFFRRST
jgi:hypothetical protein